MLAGTRVSHSPTYSTLWMCGTISTTVSGNSSKMVDTELLSFECSCTYTLHMCGSTYVWVFMHMQACVCRGQRSFSSVFQEASTLSFFCCFVFLKTETGCLTSLYFAKQTILPCRGAPEILLSLPLQCWDYMCVSPHSALLHGFGGQTHVHMLARAFYHLSCLPWPKELSIKYN